MPEATRRQAAQPRRVDRFLAEQDLGRLEGAVAEFSEAIVDGTRAARDCFTEVARAFQGSAEDVAEEAGKVEGLLAQALLILTINVQEAAEARRRDVARLTEEAQA